MDFTTVINSVNSYKQAIQNLGGVLHEAKGVYPDLVGEGINTWRDFVEQPEIGLTVREANSLIELSNWLSGTLVPLCDLNLATARFGASRGISDPNLVEDMRVLSLKDFKERHYDVVKGEDNAPRTYEYMVMKRCKETGSLQRVYGEEETGFIKEYSKEIENG